MNTVNLTSKKYFNSLKIIYLILLIGQLLFLAIVAFSGFNLLEEGDETSSLTNIFKIVAAVLAIGGVSGGRMIFQMRVNIIKTKTDLIEKMNDYRSALIIKFALLEGPAFFGIIGYMLTGNNFFLLVAGFLILVFALHYPMPDRTIKELELSSEEVERVENPNEIIA